MAEKTITRQCTARSSRTGEQCRNSAILGGTVCRTHGGSAPQVQRAAKLRLLELVDPAIATLARALTAQDSRWPDKIRAVENILDRAGHPRSTQVDIDDAREELLSKLLEMKGQAE